MIFGVLGRSWATRGARAGLLDCDWCSSLATLRRGFEKGSAEVHTLLVRFAWSASSDKYDE